LILSGRLPHELESKDDDKDYVDGRLDEEHNSGVKFIGALVAVRGTVWFPVIVCARGTQDTCISFRTVLELILHITT